MIRLFEMFAGYGGASFALKKAGINFECVGYSEIDKSAINCYERNFHGVKNYGDCTKINPSELPDFDLLTGGFPCQDVSVAGHRDLSNGRTILFDEIIRIASIKKPMWLFLENVEGIKSINHGHFFDYIISEIKRIGYDVRYKLLNSKDFGIPQNRNRYFFVCRLKPFIFGERLFPFREELCLKLSNLLEEKVNEKYYLSDNKVKSLLSKYKPSDFNDIANCLDSNMQKGVTPERYFEKHQRNIVAVIDSFNNSISKDQSVVNSLRTNFSNGNSMIIPVLTPDRPIKRQNGRKFKDNDEPMFTLTSQDKHGIYDGLRIRRLTPEECFRLMGFINDEIKLDGLSDSAKYKLAGNGWDVNLVSKIFKILFTNNSNNLFN